MKKTLTILFTITLLITGAIAAPDKKSGIKKATDKTKPELVAIELEGKIIKTETKGKNDQTYKYFYIEIAKGEKVRLTKTALPKTKKNKDGKKTKPIILDELVGLNVKLTGKGYTKELKNKKKRTYVQTIVSIEKN
ncbi:MAG: hypothetical protein HOL08_11065 [Opitutae bacterium]|jgi:hypothetical protein|nr:hypothetical protein [Opitutae bacterium]